MNICTTDATTKYCIPPDAADLRINVPRLLREKSSKSNLMETKTGISGMSRTKNPEIRVNCGRSCYNMGPDLSYF
jgi:hypothetical protein